MMAEPQKTTTAEALLGMLSLGPMSGYEMKQTIAGSIGNFWSESFGQIYPTLKRLEAEGAISSRELQDPDGGRLRRVFTLEAAGRERLTEWLRIAPREQVPRNELLLKLFFGPLAPAGAACEQMVAEREIYSRRLAHYRAIERDLVRQHARNPGLPFWLVTVRYGIAETEAHLRWADETLAELEALERRRKRQPRK